MSEAPVPEVPKTLWQKLLEVQKAIPYIQQDRRQTFGEKFGYVSSAQALSLVRAKMDELGLLLTCSVVEHAVHVEGAYTHKDVKQHLTEILFEFTWVNVDDPTETAAYRWYGQGIDSGEKGVGKAATYAEKYFLLKFFHVATGTDDPDAHLPEPAPEAAPEPAGPPPGIGKDGKPQNLAGLANAMALDGTPEKFVKPAAELNELDWAARKSYTPDQLQGIRIEAHSMWQIEQSEAQEAVA